ncbi:hypothetical protein ACU4GD_09750 [Cupriavidus basilensis]
MCAAGADCARSDECVIELAQLFLNDPIASSPLDYFFRLSQAMPSATRVVAMAKNTPSCLGRLNSNRTDKSVCPVSSLSPWTYPNIIVDNNEF